jgi:hypothetical protein
VPVINWILNQQIQLGMILCACLFVPWGQRRSCFVPRLAAGVWAFLALTDTLAFLPRNEAAAALSPRDKQAGA